MIAEPIPDRDRSEIESQAAELVEALARPGGVAPDAFDHAAQLGLAVRRDGGHAPGIAGRLEIGPGGTAVVLNDADPYRRQNFALAHEIGHHRLHPARSWVDTNRTIYGRASWRGGVGARRAEYQANLFAAALLMPEPEVRRSWDLLRSPDDLAGRFRVAKGAMRRRLEALGLIAIAPAGMKLVDLSPLAGDPARIPTPGLEDESGPIPHFGPIRLDDQGRILPIPDEEWAARQAAFHRALRVISRATDDGPSSDLR